MQGPPHPRAKARRRAAAVVAALLAHALIFAGLSLTHALPQPPELRPMEVLLVPPPFRPQHAPRPPRQTARAPTDAPASHSPPKAPHTPPTRPPQAALGDWRVKPEAPGPQEPARKSLRALIGCESRDLLALTPQERQACADKLAAGIRDAPLYAVVSPKLKKQFDGEYVCPEGDVWCEYRMGKAPFPGLLAPHGRPKKYREWD